MKTIYSFFLILARFVYWWNSIRFMHATKKFVRREDFTL